MTEIRFLPENSAPSTEDWLVVQRNSGETEKTQIQNLPIIADTTAIQEQIADLEEQITQKATINHEHSMLSVDGLLNALDFKADKSIIANTVSVLETAIDGKADNGHTQPISTITGLQTVLDNKANVGATGFNYDQVTLPNNPTAGQTWRERKSNGMILRDWEYDGTDWMSIQDFSISNYSNQVNGRATLITTSANNDNYWLDSGGNFYMDDGNKGIFVKTSCLHLSAQGTNDLNNYWRIRLHYHNTGQSTLLPGEYFSTDVAPFRNYERWLNHDFKIYRGTTNNTTLHGIRGYFRAFGSPTNFLISFSTSYKLIR